MIMFTRNVRLGEVEGVRFTQVFVLTTHVAAKAMVMKGLDYRNADEQWRRMNQGSKSLFEAPGV